MIMKVGGVIQYEPEVPYFGLNIFYFKITMIIQTYVTYTQKIGLELKYMYKPYFKHRSSFKIHHTQLDRKESIRKKSIGKKVSLLSRKKSIRKKSISFNQIRL